MRVAGRVRAEVMTREGQDEQGWRGGVGGDGVSERKHRIPSIMKTLWKHPVCFSQKVSSQEFTGWPQNKGTRMLEELLLLLQCHCVASGDPAKPSSLSKEVRTQRRTVPIPVCLSRAQN